MIKFNTLKEVVQFRITESEDNYWIEEYWSVAIEMFTKDVSATIMFFQNECNDEELYVLSEIFEEIAEKTQSREIVSALRSRLSKVSSENYNQQNFQSEHMRKWVDYAEYVRSVKQEIDYAQGCIDADEEK